MKISCTDFENNGQIPRKYTCDGENIPPILKVLEVKDQAQSLILVLDDPDAPSGSFTHWIVWNIDPKTLELSDKLPFGAVEGINGSGKSGYLGPCPPSGVHRYIFTLYALDRKINLKPESSRDDLENEIKDSIIDKAELIGLYQKS